MSLSLAIQCASLSLIFRMLLSPHRTPIYILYMFIIMYVFCAASHRSLTPFTCTQRIYTHVYLYTYIYYPICCKRIIAQPQYRVYYTFIYYIYTYNIYDFEVLHFSAMAIQIYLYIIHFFLARMFRCRCPIAKRCMLSRKNNGPNGLNMCVESG